MTPKGGKKNRKYDRNRKRGQAARYKAEDRAEKNKRARAAKIKRESERFKRRQVARKKAGKPMRGAARSRRRLGLARKAA